MGRLLLGSLYCVRLCNSFFVSLYKCVCKRSHLLSVSMGPLVWAFATSTTHSRNTHARMRIRLSGVPPLHLSAFTFSLCVSACVCVSVESLKEERWGGTMCRLTPIRCTRCSIWKHLCMYARASNGRFTSPLLKPQSACSPHSRSPPFLLPRGPCFRGRTIRPPDGMCASSGVCHALLTCFYFFFA